MRAKDSEANLTTSDSKAGGGRGALRKWPRGARRPQLHLQAEEHSGQDRDKGPGERAGKPQSPREPRVWVQQAAEGQAGLCRGRGAQ